MDPVGHLPQHCHPRRTYGRVSQSEERLDRKSFPVCPLLCCHEGCWTHITVMRRSRHLSPAWSPFSSASPQSMTQSSMQAWPAHLPATQQGGACS